MSIKKFIIFFCCAAFVVFLVSLSATKISRQSKDQNKQKILNDQIISAVESFRSNGLITDLNAQTNQVFVKPELWEKLPNKNKESTASLLGYYFGIKKNASKQWIEIINTHTQEKINEYGTNAQKIRGVNSLLLGLFFFLVMALIYFLPTVVSVTRKAVHSSGIIILNLFLGWTFIGWVIALIWAVTSNPKPSLTKP